MKKGKRTILTLPESPYRILDVPFDVDKKAVNKAMMAHMVKFKRDKAMMDKGNKAQHRLTQPAQRMVEDAMCLEVDQPELDLAHLRGSIPEESNNVYCRLLENPAMLSDLGFPDNLRPNLEVDELGQAPYREGYKPDPELLLPQEPISAAVKTDIKYPVLAISLGESDAVMCLPGDEPEIILNREGEDFTPIEIFFKQSKKTGDNILVGKQARDFSSRAGKNRIYYIMDLLGRSFDDPLVERLSEKVSFEIVPCSESPGSVEEQGDDVQAQRKSLGRALKKIKQKKRAEINERNAPAGKAGDAACVRLGDDIYTPGQLLTLVLQKLKKDAESNFGSVFGKAVITTSPYFTEKQKKAVLDAAGQAGFEVLKIVDSPIAAAASLGIDKAELEKDIVMLVFKMGPRCTEFSILHYSRETYSIIALDGDQFAGADDLRATVVDYLVSRAEVETGVPDPASNNNFISDLTVKTKEAMELFSGQESCEILIKDSLLDDDGTPAPFDYELTRDEVESVTDPLISKIIKIVNRVLKSANMNRSDIDLILPVLDPGVDFIFRKALEKKFGVKNRIKTPSVKEMLGDRKVMESLKLEKCEAMGAGIYAAAQFADQEADHAG